MDDYTASTATTLSTDRRFWRGQRRHLRHTAYTYLDFLADAYGKPGVQYTEIMEQIVLETSLLESVDALARAQNLSRHAVLVRAVAHYRHSLATLPHSEKIGVQTADLSAVPAGSYGRGDTDETVVAAEMRAFGRRARRKAADSLAAGSENDS